ncbi:hypothetical protein [Salinibacterium amurskyense]|uniref:hypothetical protein n=1 Tax=Salinibacterium amurskyense TaxID=205941 RepID=UPI000EF440AC|nr:hypothetical protein [Salinibacterium amurskyense]
MIALQPTEDESSAIVLLEAPLDASTVRNLVKMNRNAEIIWRAELPHPNSADCYVSCGVDADANVVATTWSGYRVLLAGDTGIVLSYEFVK